MPRNSKSPARTRPGPGPAAQPAGRASPTRPATFSPDHPLSHARIEAIFALRAFSLVWRDALDEWNWRRAAAADAVRKSTWTETEAATQLQPWLAIVCLCGCDLPELQEGLARLHTYRRDDPDQGTTEPQARLLLADEICAERRWREKLVAAFGKANDRLRGEHTPAQAEHVQRLMRLIGALGEKLPPVPFTPDLERMEAA